MNRHSSVTKLKAAGSSALGLMSSQPATAAMCENEIWQICVWAPPTNQRGRCKTEAESWSELKNRKCAVWFGIWVSGVDVRLRHVGASVARHQVNNSRLKQAAAFPATLHLRAFLSPSSSNGIKSCFFSWGEAEHRRRRWRKRQLSRRQ